MRVGAYDHMVDKKQAAQARSWALQGLTTVNYFQAPDPLLPKGPLTSHQEASPAEDQTPEAGRNLTSKSVHVPHSSAI